jgi:hypothetical protein
MTDYTGFITVTIQLHSAVRPWTTLDDCWRMPLPPSVAILSDQNRLPPHSLNSQVVRSHLLHGDAPRLYSTPSVLNFTVFRIFNESLRYHRLFSIGYQYIDVFIHVE